MKTQPRIYQIDLFRFLAALGVVLYHYTFRGAVSNMTRLNFPELGEYFKYGIYGVHFFFIISGFVIPLSIEDGSIRKFVISRITRLYPAYWFCVIVTFLVILMLGSPFFSATFAQMIGNLTMVQKYLGIDDIDGVYWTLLVELKFYALILLFLVLNKKIRFSLEKFTACWLGLTLLLLPFLSSETYVIKAANFFIIGQWSSFFTGGIIFYLIYARGVKVKYLVMLAASLGISMYNVLYNSETGINAFSEEFHARFSPVVVSALIAIFYIVFFLTVSHRLQFLNSSKLLKLGVLTYPLYLIHENVGFILFNHLADHAHKYIVLFSVIGFMFLFAFWINKKIEVPLGKALKRKLNKWLFWAR